MGRDGDGMRRGWVGKEIVIGWDGDGIENYGRGWDGMELNGYGMGWGGMDGMGWDGDGMGWQPVHPSTFPHNQA